MSFEITKSDFTVIKNISDWQPRPAMQEAMGQLCSVFSEAYPNAETGDTWVSFDNAVGRTTIFATPVDIKTPDGYHLVDRLVVKTVLPEGAWELSARWSNLDLTDGAVDGGDSDHGVGQQPFKDCVHLVEKFLGGFQIVFLDNGNKPLKVDTV